MNSVELNDLTESNDDKSDWVVVDGDFRWLVAQGLKDHTDEV